MAHTARENHPQTITLLGMLHRLMVHLLSCLVTPSTLLTLLLEGLMHLKVDSSKYMTL
jgi:hypothetical protein